jgi:hypothetical protein
LNLDLGVAFAQMPGTNIRYYGGELRRAILPVSTLVPAVAVRGTLTKPTGVDQLDLDTRNLDFSISQGFANITLYGGIGQVWVKSTPVGVPLLHGEDFDQTKVFAGVNINLIGANLVFEADSTGSTTSVGAKLGIRFCAGPPAAANAARTSIRAPVSATRCASVDGRTSRLARRANPHDAQIDSR